MKTFNNFPELRTQNPTLYEFMAEPFREDWLSDYDKENFSFLFGGDLCVVEASEELSQIKGVDGSALTDAVDTYDIAVWYKDYAIFALMTNNSGGTTYAIPKEIAEQCVNVEASIQMHAGE